MYYIVFVQIMAEIHLQKSQIRFIALLCGKIVKARFLRNHSSQWYKLYIQSRTLVHKDFEHQRYMSIFHLGLRSFIFQQFKIFFPPKPLS